MGLQWNSCLRNIGGTTGSSSSQRGRCCEEMEWAAPWAGRTADSWDAKRAGSKDGKAGRKVEMWDGMVVQMVGMRDGMVGRRAGS